MPSMKSESTADDELSSEAAAKLLHVSRTRLNSLASHVLQ